MSWAYRIFFPLLLIPALPYYIWRMLRRGGYGTGFSQRLGFFPKLGPKTPGKLRYWIQAVSVGEMEAIGPLLRQLKATGKAEIILTTTTSTGYRLAKDRYADVAARRGTAQSLTGCLSHEARHWNACSTRRDSEELVQQLRQCTEGCGDAVPLFFAVEQQ